MRLVERREPIGGQKCKTDADFDQLQCLFSAAHRAYQVFLTLVSQRNKISHPFRIPIRKIGMLCLEDRMLFQTLWGWNWPAYTVEMDRICWAEIGYILYVFFIHLLSCLLARLPDCLPGSVFKQTGRECIFIMCCLWICVKKAKINYVILTSSCPGLLYVCFM